MRLIVEIPNPQEAMTHACPVPLATRGVRWSESCLEQNAKDTGVYVIHHAGIIKYVGKTDAPTMSYGMRLRREFQETASSGKHNYPKLALLSTPPEIMVSFFSSKAIDSLVKAEGLTLNAWGKVEVFETALTHAYDPEFQRHHAVRMEKHLRKLGIRKEVLEALVKIKQQPGNPSGD
jgi:hypothetical protein